MAKALIKGGGEMKLTQNDVDAVWRCGDSALREVGSAAVDGDSFGENPQFLTPLVDTESRLQKKSVGRADQDRVVQFADPS